MKTLKEKTLAKNAKIGDNVRFSLINKPEWNPSCNDIHSKITAIENRYITFENGYVLDKWSQNNFVGLYNKDGELQLIID